MSKRVRKLNLCHSIVSTSIPAPTFKLFGNSLILGTMEVMAESLTLAEKAGVDSSVALSLLNGQYTWSQLKSLPLMSMHR